MASTSPEDKAKKMWRLVLVSALHVVSAYDLGEDVTLCWVSNTTTSTTEREECSDAYMQFANLAELPATMNSGQEYTVTYSAHVPAGRDPAGPIPHANVHSCLRDVGFCTPFVANQPGLATHSAALQSTLSQGTASFTSAVRLDPGQYTVIIHGRWFDGSGLKHDMARATIRDVAAPRTAVYISIALGSFLV